MRCLGLLGRLWADSCTAVMLKPSAVDPPSCARRRPPPLHPQFPAAQPSDGRRREGGRKRDFPRLSAHAVGQLPTPGSPGRSPDLYFEPQLGSVHRKGRVPSLAENFPANHSLASPSAWSGGGSSEQRAVTPAWKFAWEPRDSKHGSASPASSEFRHGSGQGPLRGCASNSLKFKA